MKTKIINKIEEIERAKICFFNIEPSRSNMSYKLTMYTNNGYCAENKMKFNGCGTERTFQYFYNLAIIAEIPNPQDWAYTMKLKTIII